MLFHIYNTKTLYPWGINDASIKRKVVHLCKGSGMLPLHVQLRNFGSF